MADQRRESAEVSRSAQERARLGQRLREAREYLGLSLELVAEQAGLMPAVVASLEGGRKNIGDAELERLAHVLKCPVAALLADDEVAVSDAPHDAAYRALFRSARDLGDEDRRQVLRFARFLEQAGPAPIPAEDRPEP